MKQLLITPTDKNRVEDYGALLSNPRLGHIRLGYCDAPRTPHIVDGTIYEDAIGDAEHYAIERGQACLAERSALYIHSLYGNSDIKLRGRKARAQFYPIDDEWELGDLLRLHMIGRRFDAQKTATLHTVAAIATPSGYYRYAQSSSIILMTSADLNKTESPAPEDRVMYVCGFNQPPKWIALHQLLSLHRKRMSKDLIDAISEVAKDDCNYEGFQTLMV
jgi:hypothetical protein